MACFARSCRIGALTRRDELEILALECERLNNHDIGTRQECGGVPNVPALAESGAPAYDVTVSWGLIVLVHTPQPLVALLAETFGKWKKVARETAIRAEQEISWCVPFAV